MRSIIEFFGRALFILCFAFLAFIGGALVILTGTFPAETLRDACRAKQALDLQ